MLMGKVVQMGSKTESLAWMVEAAHTELVAEEEGEVPQDRFRLNDADSQVVGGRALGVVYDQNFFRLFVHFRVIYRDDENHDVPPQTCGRLQGSEDNLLHSGCISRSCRPPSRSHKCFPRRPVAYYTFLPSR